jgi:hypothetical protein
VSGEVGHLEAIEHGQLNGLLRPHREHPAGLVELLDEVDGTQIGTPELGKLAAEGKAGPDPAHEPDLGEGRADIGDRGLRQAQSPGELARAESDRAILGQDIKDRCRPRHRRRERLDRRTLGFIRDGAHRDRAGYPRSFFLGPLWLGHPLPVASGGQHTGCRPAS